MNGRFPQMGMEGARVRTRPERLHTELVDAALVDDPAAQEIQWADGVANGGGWINVDGFTRIIVHAKAGDAAEYVMEARQGLSDEDPEVIGTVPVVADTKTAIFDEEVAGFHSVRFLARPTGAETTHRLFLILR